MNIIFKKKRFLLVIIFLLTGINNNFSKTSEEDSSDTGSEDLLEAHELNQELDNSEDESEEQIEDLELKDLNNGLDNKEQAELDKQERDRRDLIEILKLIGMTSDAELNTENSNEEKQNFYDNTNEKNPKIATINLKDLFQQNSCAQDNDIDNNKDNYISPYSNLKTEDLPILGSIFEDEIPYELLLAIERLKKNQLRQRKHGIIFYGPPGTGKTTAAELIGRYTNREILFTNGSSFITKYQGSGTEAVKKLFDYARWLNKPVLIIIDEIDSATQSKDNDYSMNKAEHANTMTQIIHQMNMIEDDPNIFVIGTTNHELSIEGAIRSRFDLIEIKSPDLESRKNIITNFLNKNKLRGENLSQSDQYVSNNTISDLAKYSKNWDSRNIIAALLNGVDGANFEIESQSKKSLPKRILEKINPVFNLKNKSHLEIYLYKAFEDQKNRTLGNDPVFSIKKFKAEFKKQFTPTLVNRTINRVLYPIEMVLYTVPGVLLSSVIYSKLGKRLPFMIDKLENNAYPITSCNCE